MKITPKTKNKIELLAPAGSLEKLKYAIHYGADAVYAGIPDVSMRARVNSFSEDSLATAVEYVHQHGKKIFVTLNIYAHNFHLPKVEKHLKFLKKINPDGVIVSDPGIIALVKKYLPKTEIHLSTQANTTNWQSAKFWYDLGIKRIVLAREVTLEDIREIHRHVPKLELEYFVHGAMCMSYSGRCILSKWMSGKSANEGDCTQPCRWAYTQRKTQDTRLDSQDELFVDARRAKNKSQTNFNPPAGGPNSKEYKTMSLKEVQQGHGLELEEDSHGTYFFNSKDLNLVAHIDELIKAGVTSLKIEGRNKSVYYVANVVRAYRHVLDVIEAKKPLAERKKSQKWASKELDKLENRGYTKGFLLGNEPEHAFFGNSGVNSHQFVGEVLASEGKKLRMKIHNALKKEDLLEAVVKDKNLPFKVLGIFDEDGQEVSSAHGGHKGLYDVIVNKEGIEPLSLIRKILK